MANLIKRSRGLTCGDSGGLTNSGSPCRVSVPNAGARCKLHPAESTVPAAKPGRPRKDFGEGDYGKIEKLAAMLTQDQLAPVFGMSPRTFRNRLSEDPRAAAAYELGKSLSIASVAETLLKKAKGGDTTSMIFYLKTQGGWSEKQRLEITNVRRSFEEWIRDLSDTELRRLESMGEDALLAEYERACPSPNVG